MKPKHLYKDNVTIREACSLDIKAKPCHNPFPLSIIKEAQDVITTGQTVGGSIRNLPDCIRGSRPHEGRD